MLMLFGKRFLLVQCVYVSERACADTLFFHDIARHFIL